MTSGISVRRPLVLPGAVMSPHAAARTRGSNDLPASRTSRCTSSCATSCGVLNGRLNEWGAFTDAVLFEAENTDEQVIALRAVAALG